MLGNLLRIAKVRDIDGLTVKTTNRQTTATVPNAAVPSPQPIGRPRLVAKTTSSIQQKMKTFKPAAPDPMQVWNKNRGK